MSGAALTLLGMDKFITFTEEDWLDWWDSIFYGDENRSEMTHVCDPVETKQCVDCAKFDTCWNDNGIYIICTDCLVVESQLEMNQVDEDFDE